MKDKIVYATAARYSTKRIRAITCRLADEYDDVCIISPAVMFGCLDREEVYDNSITLLDMCDEMWVLDDEKNMHGYEAENCRKHKIPIRIIRR